MAGSGHLGDGVLCWVRLAAPGCGALIAALCITTSHRPRAAGGSLDREVVHSQCRSFHLIFGTWCIHIAYSTCNFCAACYAAKECAVRLVCTLVAGLHVWPGQCMSGIFATGFCAVMYSVRCHTLTSSMETIVQVERALPPFIVYHVSYLLAIQ